MLNTSCPLGLVQVAQLRESTEEALRGQDVGVATADMLTPNPLDNCKGTTGAQSGFCNNQMMRNNTQY